MGAPYFSVSNLDVDSDNIVASTLVTTKNKQLDLIVSVISSVNKRLTLPQLEGPS